MQEQVRQAYLAAMDVVCYVRRLPPFSALSSPKPPSPKPSPKCSSPKNPSVPLSKRVAPDIEQPTATRPLAAVDREVQAVTTDVVSAPPSPQFFPQPSPQPPPSPPVVQQQPSVKAPRGDTSKTVTVAASLTAQLLALAVLAVPNHLLLIDECPPLLSKSASYQRLLHNIVRALGLPVENLSAQHFQWPLLKANTLCRSESAAREALQAYLDRCMLQTQPQHVLVMGDTLANVLESDVPIVYTISASPLLEQPARKAVLWQQLRASILLSQ